ncbi:MAG: restriction endonuclease subunit S [Rhodobacteraceae bacterium]|nr:restriction endonuclease subunit S [Paracoccaceae bacterium]
MKLGDVADIRIGTQLNKTSMVMTGEYPVMNGGVKPSGRHNQFNAEPDSIAMSQGGSSAGHVNFMPIRFWAGAHCCVVTSKTPDVLTKHLFHVLKKRQGILMSSQSGGGHAIPGLRKAVPENLEISHPPPSRNRRGLLENWVAGRNWRGK